MADAGHSLMIKYGLPRAPEASEIERWAALTDRLVAQGNSREQAGRNAASTVFTGFETCKYASMADDIEAILQSAKERK